MDTKELIAQRRAALFNIKVKNAGSNDYFGKDVSKERKLEIEREKLAVFLRSKGYASKPDELLQKIKRSEYQ